MQKRIYDFLGVNSKEENRRPRDQWSAQRSFNLGRRRRLTARTAVREETRKDIKEVAEKGKAKAR